MKVQDLFGEEDQVGEFLSGVVVVCRDLGSYRFSTDKRPPPTSQYLS